MSLKEYRRKRDFKKTPEPSPKKSTSPGRLYVIQKHDASHLHYDFRLEMDGVLKSWAVPKGPSLDPSIKRLAVHVEDHPIDYGSFEGIIPQGEYGGGTVMLWDQGEWINEEDTPEKAYKNGKLSFILKGKKLKGAWKLIQIKKDPKNWLLMKVNDKYARPESEYDITLAKPKSVTSRKSLEQIEKQFTQDGSTKPKKKILTEDLLKKYRLEKSVFPKKILPELATLVNDAPQGAHWAHEIKYDGYRILAFIKDKQAHLITRGQQDWTHKLLKLSIAIKSLKVNNAIFDGEIVVVNNDGHFDFQELQNTIHQQSDTAVIYYIFDILYYNDYNLMSLPLVERKNILKNVIATTKSPLIQYSDYLSKNGEEVFSEACELGFEGIVSKDLNSTYVQKRTQDWVKTKCSLRQEFVVVGFTQPQGQRQYFGSLLLAFYNENKKLQYCGHVGTGFNEKTLKEMNQLLRKNLSSTKKFEVNTNISAAHRSALKKASWVNPNIVVEVEFSQWTQDKILRHPSFKGIRTDKSAKEVIMERPQKIADNKENSYSLTHPERILYPEIKATKLDLANYYNEVQEWMLPYICDRPLTLLRCPEGWKAECFFQKHIHEKMQKSLHRIEIQEKKLQKYIYIKDFDGLIALVQLGVLEIHPWNCRIDNIEKPDLIVFDLDPDVDIPWKRVIQAAFHLKEELESFNLQSFVKTTGGKGLHVVVPFKRHYGWDEVKAFSEAFVNYLALQNPEEYVATVTKARRKGKIFIDYIRNSRGATSIAPYSTRAREGAPVAMPLHWDELNNKLKSNAFNIENAPKRLAQLKTDPWEGFLSLKQSLNLKKFL